MELDLESCAGESISGKPFTFRFVCSAFWRAAFRMRCAPESLPSSSPSAKLPAVISADGCLVALAPTATWLGVRVRVRVRVRVGVS